ncbi:MAG: Gfo/Idh/MocA family oxidoreductase, partial [Thermoguttaceae bacterium]
MNTKRTRRQFLGNATSAAAVGWAGAKLYAADAPAKPGPNETLNLALIGCGNRGRQLVREFQKVDGARVIAVCDVERSRMLQARKEAGGSKVATYHDFRKLLENKDVDAVVIASTDNWHCFHSIYACQAGKDVYVEKPLGNSVAEGRAAITAAEKYDRIVQIGTQQRSWDHYRKAVEIIQSGRLGEISEVKVWDYFNVH